MLKFRFNRLSAIVSPVFVGVALALSPSALADDARDYKGDPYPLSVCAVAGTPLGSMGEPVVFVHEDRQLKLCCAGCKPAFEADPAKHLAKVDELIVEQQKPHYVAERCPVGGPLGSMGEPVDIVAYNRLVRLCCAGCGAAVRRDPARHIATLDKAVAEAQRGDYPLDACPVSGEALEADRETHDVVIANRLFNLCCEGCEDALRTDAAQHLAKLDRAKAEQ